GLDPGVGRFGEMAQLTGYARFIERNRLECRGDSAWLEVEHFKKLRLPVFRNESQGASAHGDDVSGFQFGPASRGDFAGSELVISVESTIEPPPAIQRSG